MLPAPPLTSPRASNWSLWVTLFPDRRSSLPVASIEPTFSQQLLVDRYVIALSTAPTGPHRKGAVATSQARAAISLDWATYDRSWRSSVLLSRFPLPLPFLRLTSRVPPHSTVPVPACPRNKKRRTLRKRPARRSRWNGGGAGASWGRLWWGAEAVSPVRIGRHGLALQGLAMSCVMQVSFNRASLLWLWLVGWVVNQYSNSFLIGQ